MEHRFLEGRVVALHGNLVTQQVDAIVNAANASLLGGGGVDGAIHAAGGPAIREECRRIRATLYPDGMPAGHAVITRGGTLPARHVIHTVGPVYGMEDGRDDALLAQCYTRSLELAQEHGLATIAFPAISTGAFAFPADRAAGIASHAIREALPRATRVREVRLVFFDRKSLEVFVAHQVFAT